MGSQPEQGRASHPGAEPVVSEEIAAEAAVWIARLHGPSRSARMERACLAWQACSAAHRLAFERCTDVWMDVAGVQPASVTGFAAATQPEGQEAARFRPHRWAFALTAVLIAGMLVLRPWRDIESYETGVGEQRLVVLRDGTRMSLNTSTQVRVELGSARRAVEVERGEALFEVAKDAARPFVVHAAGTDVTATGTVFSVRLAPNNGAGEGLDVTLVEGQVVVQSTPGTPAAPALAQPVVMAAGERIRVSSAKGTPPAAALGAGMPQRDRPRMDQVLAWKRGEAIFDNMSLLDAMEEMNRYSAARLVGEGVDLGVLRVSGVFKTGDNASFAYAVASLHGLAVRERVDRLELIPK